MNQPTLTPDQNRLICVLTSLRYGARWAVKGSQFRREYLPKMEARASTLRLLGLKEKEQMIIDGIRQMRESSVRHTSEIVGISERLFKLSYFAEELEVPREAWLSALSVNQSKWNTAEMLEYGDTIINVVSVLNLENSATKDDGIEIRPLNWCCTMALMHKMKTSSAFDRIIHDGMNEHFDNIFGEFKERSPLERMGIPANMISKGAGHS